MNIKKHLNMYLFNFLKEVALLNNKAFYVEYQNGTTSFDILFEGSKKLPRKSKKRIRSLLIK
jgi:hypothetical protein